MIRRFDWTGRGRRQEFSVIFENMKNKRIRRAYRNKLFSPSAFMIFNFFLFLNSSPNDHQTNQPGCKQPDGPGDGDYRSICAFDLKS